MKEVMGIKKAGLTVQSYSSIQTVVYQLRSSNSSSLLHYTRQDILHTPVDISLTRNLKGAHKQYQLQFKWKQASLKNSFSVIGMGTNQMKLKTQAAALRIKEKA